MTMVAILLGMWLMLWLAGPTPVGRALRDSMILLPIRLMERITRGHVILAAAVLIVMSAILWFGAGDGARVLAMGVPDLLGWAAAFEVTTYLDVVVALVATSSVLKIRMMAKMFVSRSLRVARPRARRRATRPTADNDDRDSGHFALVG